MKQYREIARQIVKKEGLYKNMDQAELCEQTNFWREKFKTKPMTDRDKINIFALAREAASRIIGLDAVVVQLIGALVLGDGKVAEMKTGEGKTLMSLFVMFIEVMRGNRVHLVTANEYLARRDREEIGQVLEYLGVSVALNESGLDIAQKRPFIQQMLFMERLLNLVLITYATIWYAKKKIKYKVDLILF